MNYLRIYEELITNAKNRFVNIEYPEIHHIIPKCIGGINDSKNLVKLTIREHCIAHKLLFRIFPEEDCLFFSYNAMYNIKYNGRKTTREIGILKIEFRNRMKYLWRDEEWRFNLLSKRQNVIDGYSIEEHNERFCSQKGIPKVPMKESTKQKLSRVDRSYTQTDEYRRNMSKSTSGEKNGMFGKNHTNETKKKISENIDRENLSSNTSNQWKNKEIREKMIKNMSKPREERTCPHCGLVGRGGTMTRYHFDNCKDKQ